MPPAFGCPDDMGIKVQNTIIKVLRKQIFLKIKGNGFLQDEFKNGRKGNAG